MLLHFLAEKSAGDGAAAMVESRSRAICVKSVMVERKKEEAAQGTVHKDYDKGKRTK
jgi:hypothetical protein